MPYLQTSDVALTDHSDGTIYDLTRHRALTAISQYTDLINTTHGTTANVAALPAGGIQVIYDEYDALHPPTVSTAEARATVREKYLLFLKREPGGINFLTKQPDTGGWDFWTAAYIQLVKDHGQSAALAELNHAFTSSDEYVALQTALLPATSGGTATPPVTTGTGTTPTTTAAGTGFFAKLAALPTIVKIGGAVVAVVGLSMLGGKSGR